jgi:pimeloyl-ACP methyl ester carboxylesterase
MRHISVAGGLKIAWDSHGDGEPVMLVHGLGFSSRHWKHQTELLTGAGYRVITFDLRGFGGSEMPTTRYRMTELADDLELVRQAAEVDALHLVGHSMGGMVVMQYVLAHPEQTRSLVLASTTSHNGRRASAFARVMSKLSRRGFDAAKADPEVWGEVESILAAVVPVTGPVLHILEGLTTKPHPARAMAWDAISEFSVKDEVARIRQPTLVMHGTNDANIPYVNGRLVAEGIAGAELVTVDGGEHNLPLENVELFNEALLRHLSV